MKYLISTILGFLSGFLLLSVFEFLALQLFPLPHEINLQNINSITENIELIPVINYIMLLVSFALSSLFAGYISGKIKTENASVPLLIIGLLFTIGCFIYFFRIPQPIWMVIVSSVIFLPASFLGGRLALGFKKLHYT